MDTTFGNSRDFAGYDADEVREMSEKEKVLMMTEWFAQQFEDPQNETPYNKDLGGYVYPWGGPFDASDQIQHEFSDVVDFDTMMLAIDQVQSDGIAEWAPQSGGDFYEHPEDDRVAAGEIVDGDGEWPPIIVEQAPIPPEPEARVDVVRRLDELEGLIRPLIDRIKAEAQAPAMIGHNNPPEELEIAQAVPREEWLQVKTAIEEIRRQTASDEPITAAIESSNSRLVKAGQGLVGWIANKVDIAVNTAVAAGTLYGFANLEIVLTALKNAVQAVQTWIASMPLPF